MKKSAGVLALVASASLLAAAHAGAETLKYAQGNPQSAPSIKAAESGYAPAVEKYSGGSLTVRVFPQSLLKNEEASAGLRDGVADIAMVLTSYFPSEYANFSMIADLSMMVTSTRKGPEIGLYAFVGALMEYTFFDCPKCQDEFKAQNQVYMGGFATTPFMLTCSRPVTTLADMAGLDIRAVGASLSRWTTFVGANPITMPSSEFLQALSQGVVDCVETTVVDSVNLGLADVATHMTLNVPGGTFSQVAGANVNRDVWTRLSAEQRVALMRGSAAQAADTVAIYLDQNKAAQEKLRAGGKIQFHEAAPDLWAKTQEFIAQDQKTIVEYYEKNFGIQNGAAEVQKFVGLFDRWIGLVENAGTGDAVRQIYWDELFARLSADSYGL